MHEVVEPPGVRRATRVMFVLFAVVGAVTGVAALASGEGLFGLVFGGMFGGIPWLVHRASVGPGVPGFTLTSDGILGAADDETRVIPWGEVDHLAWRSTGLTVNDQACLALHAELVDGRSVRVGTYTARRGREVDEVEEQVRASGLLPAGVGFGAANGRRRPANDAAPSSRHASDGASAASQPQSWADLPVGVRGLLVGILLAFLAPLVAMFVIISVALFDFAGVVGLLVSAGFIAAAAVLALAVIRQRRTPVLACSFTVEGVVADHGDGLTVPWGADVALAVASTVANDGPLVSGGTGRGWVVELQRPDREPLALSPVLASPSKVRRATAELGAAKRMGLIPDHVPLTLPLDLPDATAKRIQDHWTRR